MNPSVEPLGAAVLALGTVDPPASGTPVRDVAFPIALDAGELLGAVAFATWNPYPGGFEPQWWCTVELFVRDGNSWHACGGEHDNTTSAMPFQRPVEGDWIEWHSNGGVGGWDEEPRTRFSFFGVAPTGTDRLTVRDEDGHERDLRITPWNGAYVAVVAGETATLTGYDASGHLLGAYDLPGEAEPPQVDVEPGWRRVLPPPSDEIGGEPILVIRDDDPLPPGWREDE
jgi:hypothetical protein